MPPFDLITMLTYMRPAYSRAERKFLRRYVEPLMGSPDIHGNYTLTVQGNPHRIAFIAHSDTVHKQQGRQHVKNTNGVLTSNSDCLGADCTTGVWLILNMIAHDVPGLYVIHAAEEIGCKGSRAFVKENPELLATIDFAISLDRKGTKSIITHQLGYRTASDSFALTLSSILGLPQLEPDDTGIYTDSNEYADDVSECTNLSVGYFKQHTPKEHQDVVYAELLLSKLIDPNTRWDLLKPHRTPGEWAGGYSYSTMEPDRDILDLVRDYPLRTASLLEDLGYDARDLAELLGVGVGSRRYELEYM